MVRPPRLPPRPSGERRRAVARQSDRGAQHL